MKIKSTHACTRRYCNNLVSCKRSQVTIFIIIAIVLVAGIIGYLALRDKLFIQKLPAQFQPIETYFLNCINEKVLQGKEILLDKGGYIDTPDFQPGSEYRPFSNQLDFFGTAIPYWYYVSGNNIITEQMPTKIEMQNQLAKYVENNLDCDFADYESQGYEINVSLNSVAVTINDLSIDANVNAALSVAKEDQSARQTVHETTLDSRLGKFYNTAIMIYNYEKQNAFLEDYAVDVLRNYAPVDGVEVSCSPKMWVKSQVDEELKAGLEANTQAIKLNGNYYTAGVAPEDKYFVQNLQVDEAVNFMYSPQWPTRIEVWESNNGVMLAEPIGLQQGMGILGFCYVPYHFVYDINYPVLVQVYDSQEIFQFPFAVIIDKNKQREALPGSTIPDTTPELCKYAVEDVSVYTYDNKLSPVEADISFNCLQQTCDIGSTVKNNEGSAILEGKFPQCVNGYIIARAEGYATNSYLFSTNNPGIVDILLTKLHNLTVSLEVDGDVTKDFAIITFSSADTEKVVVWPEQKSVQLGEGEYNISVYVYKNGTITIPGMNKEQCSEVPKTGFAGLLGTTEEKCFNVNLPSQTLSNVLAAGGKGSDYFVESQLESGKIKISVESVGLPSSLEALQNNYNLVDAGSVYASFE